MNQLEEQYIIRIRVFAIMMIVMLHVCAPVRDQWEVMVTANWFVGAILDSLGRAGVPLFVMISGALLLPRKEEWSVFYKKRFSRILLPMFFWSVVFALFWQWQWQLKEEVTIVQLLVNIFSGPAYYHLWYFYMLLGLYIAAPFLQVLVQNLTKKRLEFLLLIWILFRFLLPTIFAQVSVWFNFYIGLGIQFNFPDLYIGYFILGYYLHLYGIPIKLRNQGLWFFLITVLQASASALVYYKTGSYKDFMVLPSAITVLVQAILFYSWMQNLKSSTTKRWMTLISTASFGIYLIHPLIIELFHMGIGNYHIDAKISDTIFSIPLTWISTFSVSTLIILILMRIPYLKRLVR